jgi:hypothetical protein
LKKADRVRGHRVRGEIGRSVGTRHPAKAAWCFNSALAFGMLHGYVGSLRYSRTVLEGRPAL